MRITRAPIALVAVVAALFGSPARGLAQDDFSDFGPSPAPTPPATTPPAPSSDFDDDFAAPTPTPTPAPTPTPMPATTDDTVPPPREQALPVATTVRRAPEPESQPESADETTPDPDREAVRARRQLRMQNTFHGPVGGIRVVDAGSGPVHTFRLSLMSDFMYLGDFLQSGDYVKQLGGALAFSWTAHRNVEVFAAYQSTATWNTLGNPELVQSLGDVQLGAKGFASIRPWLRVGGDFSIRFSNPVGNVGVAFRGTSFGLRGNLTFDLRELSSRSIPFIARVNAQYYFDNSANLVRGVENARYAGLDSPRPRNEEPRNLVTEAERFALGINRTDFVNLRFGFEAPIEIRERFQIDPILEWLWAIPVNRTGFVCPYLRADSDGCLDRSGAKAFPMSLTIGARVHPIVRGLSLTAAVDVGLTGTRTLTRELAPTMPYAVILGASYAYDPAARAAGAERVTERVVEVPADVAVRGHVLGTVVDREAGTPVDGAIVVFTGRDVNALVANTAGGFRSYAFEPGEVAMAITHPDYEPGTCTATIPTERPAPAATTPATDSTVTDSTALPSTSSTQATAPSLDASVTPGVAETPAPSSNVVEPEDVEVEVTVQCQLLARPRVGNANLVVNTDAGPLAQVVTITIEGPAPQSITTDATGHARLAGVTPGHYTARVEAEGFFVNQREFDVAPRGDGSVDITLVTRPRRSLVRVSGRRIQIMRQVNFVTDSDEILGTSDPLLFEVADTLARHPEIASVEIEGHTDDRGGAEHNLTLSQRRAEAVRTWLIAHGVAAIRLTARGYGLTRPLVPNITPANRARNRRVQFTIRESADATP